MRVNRKREYISSQFAKWLCWSDEKGSENYGLKYITASALTILFELENVLVELLLQRLVGEVDANLLKRIALEGLEAEDVENADTSAPHTSTRLTAIPMLIRYTLVDLCHDVIERGAVCGLHQRLARLLARDLIEGTVHDLISRPDGTIRERVRQVLGADAEQPRGR